MQQRAGRRRSAVVDVAIDAVMDPSELRPCEDATADAAAKRLRTREGTVRKPSGTENIRHRSRPTPSPSHRRRNRLWRTPYRACLWTVGGPLRSSERCVRHVLDVQKMSHAPPGPGRAPVAVSEAGFAPRGTCLTHRSAAQRGASAQPRRRRRATSPSIEAAPAAKAAFGEGRGRRGGAYAGRCRGEVDAGPLGHLVGDPVRVAEGAGLGRGVGPRSGEDDDAGGVVDPDHQDERDAEGLERLGVGRGLEQEGGELLEDLEQRRPPGTRRTTATGWGCSAARAGGRRRRRAACWPPGPGTGRAPRRSPPRPHRGRAHSMIGVSTLVATPDTATLVDEHRAERQ